MARKTEADGEILAGDRLKKLAQRKAALQDELQAIQARLEGAERKAQDREKVLLGVGVQEALKRGQMDRAAMVRLLDLLTQTDRAWMVERGWGVDGTQGHHEQPKPPKEQKAPKRQESEAAA